MKSTNYIINGVLIVAVIVLFILHFTEKNELGESRIYPLTDINPRFDKDLEKDYINGKYGAVPFIGRWDYDKRS